jgi:hypothetical protein
MDNKRYLVDKTSINILWDEDTTTIKKTFQYTDSLYNTIGEDKTAIDNITGIGVTGDSSWDSSQSKSFRLGSGLITPDASVYTALRPCYVTWPSISDMLLTDRLFFAVARRDFISDRNTYLISDRETQIKDHVTDENLLRNSLGAPGDIYSWANARWNRRQGCEAKLVSTTKQIEVSQSAAQVNRSFF